jgi:hypothetical protein
MRSHDERHGFRILKCILFGELYGVIAGIVGGPVAVLAYIKYSDYMYPGRYSGFGFEIPVGVVVGVMLGGVEGPFLALLSVIRPPKVTLWWLMVAVAGVALMLGLFVYSPWIGLIGVTVTFLIPVLWLLWGILLMVQREMEKPIS